MILNRSILSALFGNIIEYYNIALYGYLSVHLSRVFFPTEDPLTGILASFGIFASSFVMRPLGGLFFGFIGDRYGRIKALNLSITFVILPSFIIGVIPPYASIGIFSTLILVLALIIQGFCLAGEYSGAAVFINEIIPKKSEALGSSLLNASGFLGAVLATTCASFFTQAFDPLWSWRLPFILGSFLGLVGIYLRKNVAESHIFETNKSLSNSQKPQLGDVLRNNFRNAMCTFGFGVAAFIPFYTLSIYMNGILVNDLHIPTYQCLLINSGIMVFWMMLLPISGFISDKIGRKKIMKFGCVFTLLTSYFVFVFLYTDLNLENVILSQVLMSIGGILFVAPSGSILPKLFEIRHRYTGIAFSYFLGVVVFGSTTPLLNTYIVKQTGNLYFPAFYMMFGSIIGLLSLFYSREVS